MPKLSSLRSSFWCGLDDERCDHSREALDTPWEIRVQWSRSGCWCGPDDESDDSRGAICRAFEDTCAVEPLLASGVLWTTKGVMTPWSNLPRLRRHVYSGAAPAFWFGLNDERRDDSRGAICRAFEDTCAEEPLRFRARSGRRKVS